MPPPQSEAELLARCKAIEGMSFSQLAAEQKLDIPLQMRQRKGLAGQLLEYALGASAGNLAEPDFKELQIELKTIPIGALGHPVESTYITSIPLLTIHQQTWETSQCFAKLKKVLWIPLEGDTRIPYPHRRIGRALLWSPNPAQEALLKADWNHLTSQIALGQLALLDATVGEALQIRPKAAHSHSLCYSFDAEGNKVKTMPRGFYLRSTFTQSILTSV